jgi:hypothetical protein
MEWRRGWYMEPAKWEGYSQSQRGQQQQFWNLVGDPSLEPSWRDHPAF